MHVEGIGTSDRELFIENTQITSNAHTYLTGANASDQATTSVIFEGRKSRGSILSPANVQAGDRLLSLIASPYIDGNYRFSASIGMFAGEMNSAGSYSSYIDFKTTGINETARQERMRISEAGNVGIGTSTPTSALHLVKDIAKGEERALIKEHNTNAGSNGLTSFIQLAGSVNNEALGAFITYNSNYSAIPDFNGYVSILSGSTSQIGRGINLIGQKDNSNIRFYLGGVQSTDMKMILDSEGNLGIGTTTPAAKLQVSDGDIYIENINHGVIMKSPDGTCWRMTIDNLGNTLNSLLPTCP